MSKAHAVMIICMEPIMPQITISQMITILIHPTQTPTIGDLLKNNMRIQVSLRMTKSLKKSLEND